jgi:hypothetical protein
MLVKTERNSEQLCDISAKTMQINGCFESRSGHSEACPYYYALNIVLGLNKSFLQNAAII